MLDFVKGGKPFFGIHSATDTFYDWPEYGELIGGYFSGHPWTQEVRVIVEVATIRLLECWGNISKSLMRSTLSKRGIEIKPTSLMRLDNETIDLSKGNREDHDYALASCHHYGEGRVMYTALGHPDSLWHEDWFQQHINGCIKWVTGLED